MFASGWNKLEVSDVRSFLQELANVTHISLLRQTWGMSQIADFLFVVADYWAVSKNISGFQSDFSHLGAVCRCELFGSLSASGLVYNLSDLSFCPPFHITSAHPHPAAKGVWWGLSDPQQSGHRDLGQRQPRGQPHPHRVGPEKCFCIVFIYREINSRLHFLRT